MFGRHARFLPVVAILGVAAGAATEMAAALKAKRPRISSPAALPRSAWAGVLRNTYREIMEDRVQAVAAGVTFYSLLAIFPAITVFVSTYGLFANQADVVDHVAMLTSLLPSGAISIVTDQIERITSGSGSRLGLALVSGLAMAMWSANAGTKAVIEALNIAYDVRERRSFIMLNLQALLLTLGGLFTLIVLIGVVAVVPVVLHYVLIDGIIDWVLWIGRWPFIYVLLLMGLAVLYQFGPNRPGVKWRWITPGSALASAGLLVFSMLFSWYTANLGSYNETYGSLGATIAFLTWMWLSAVIVISGAEFNSEIENAARKR